MEYTGTFSKSRIVPWSSERVSRFGSAPTASEDEDDPSESKSESSSSSPSRSSSIARFVANAREDRGSVVRPTLSNAAANPRWFFARSMCALARWDVAVAFEFDRDASPTRLEKSPRPNTAADGTETRAGSGMVLRARVAKRATRSKAHRPAIAIDAQRTAERGNTLRAPRYGRETGEP
jgi:hypothetical protein